MNAGMPDGEVFRQIYIGPTFTVSGDPADTVTAIRPNGTRFSAPRRYVQSLPPQRGVAATQNLREGDPVVDAAGFLAATWLPDGPVQYWQDGQPIAAEAFGARIGQR